MSQPKPRPDAVGWWECRIGGLYAKHALWWDGKQLCTTRDPAMRTADVDKFTDFIGPLTVQGNHSELPNSSTTVQLVAENERLKWFARIILGGQYGPLLADAMLAGFKLDDNACKLLRWIDDRLRESARAALAAVEPPTERKAE